MARITGEVHFNTRDEVRVWLQAAAYIVEELELEEELRVPAFVKAVELLSAKQVFMDQGGIAPPVMHIPRGP